MTDTREQFLFDGTDDPYLLSFDKPFPFIDYQELSIR